MSHLCIVLSFALSHCLRVVHVAFVSSTLCRHSMASSINNFHILHVRAGSREREGQRESAAESELRQRMRGPSKCERIASSRLGNVRASSDRKHKWKNNATVRRHFPLARMLLDNSLQTFKRRTENTEHRHRRHHINECMGKAFNMHNKIG